MSDTPEKVEPDTEAPAQEPEEKAETDWKAEARKWEALAKKHKSAAEKLDELEESKKSEVQKALERAEAAEKRAATFERNALQARIAVEEGVIPEVLHGDTEEEMRAAAKRIKEWRDSNKVTPPKPPSSLKSGARGSDDAGLDGKERAAQALRRMRGHN